MEIKNDIGYFPLPKGTQGSILNWVDMSRSAPLGFPADGAKIGVLPDLTNTNSLWQFSSSLQQEIKKETVATPPDDFQIFPRDSLRSSNNAQYYQTFATITWPQPLHFFLVVSPGADPATAGNIRFVNENPFNNPTKARIRYANNAGSGYHINCNFGSSVRHTVGAFRYDQALISCAVDGIFSYVRFWDADNAGTRTYGNAGSNGFAGNRMTWMTQANASESCELIIFDTIQDEDTVDELEAYFRNKWATNGVWT